MSSEPLRLCCLLWAAAGEEDGLHAYEDAVLSRVPVHGGRVVTRELGDGADDTPHEVQVFEFSSRSALDGYLADPERAARTEERDRVVARTELFAVRLPDSDGGRP
ncbi:hypothetical protein [Pseudolysinimonas sp.]|uniref:hypothetical protein n=1 Tax=Pseudolysinimonas sp. TaxID=2680009 RepID=UPI003F7F6846